MAEFEVKVTRVTKVEDHPNADRLSLIYINGFAVVANKHDDGSARYKAGDLVLYVPENAVVPEKFLRLGFWNEKTDKGMLAGFNGDRVKPLKLRGILSEGIIFPIMQGHSVVADMDRPELYDVRGLDHDAVIHYSSQGSIFDVNLAEFYGFKKYVAPIPQELDGEVEHYDYPLKFDIENLKKTPDDIKDGEHVLITRKLHGTFCGIGFNDDGSAVVFSKGLGSQGMVFINNEANAQKNVYTRFLNHFRERIEFQPFSRPGFYIMGEIIGRGIQDLSYGFDQPVFRWFEMKSPENTEFKEMESFARLAGVFERVPILYSGPWEPSLLKLADGYDETGKHVHEGIVIQYGENLKKRLKVISDDYYTRKNGTEYN